MRFLTFVALLICAVLIAGIYGAVHDQISYTVSSEYFTRFKYAQFGLLDVAAPDRVKVAAIGFLATWWMGIPIGLLVGGVGFLHRPAKTMFLRSLKAFAVVTLVALLVGCGGLCYGWFFASHNLVDYERWYIPEGLVFPKNFLSVGYMHNSSYIGGLIGMYAGMVFQCLQRPYTVETETVHPPLTPRGIVDEERKRP